MCLGTAVRTPEFEKSKFIPIAACLLFVGILAAMGMEWFELETPFIQMAIIAVIANVVTIALAALYAAEPVASTIDAPSTVNSKPTTPVPAERKKPVVTIDQNILKPASMDPGGTVYQTKEALAEAEA